jgi:hypothetical protein
MWFSMKHIITICVLVILSLLGTSSSSLAKCHQMESKDYFDIRTKKGMEFQLQKEMEKMYAQFGKVDFDCLMREFDALGKRTSVMSIRGGGYDGADVFRFTVDNRINSPWWYLLGAPGGSNGVFTAIINLYKDGRIAIIERGGRVRWLTFRQKTE